MSLTSGRNGEGDDDSSAAFRTRMVEKDVTAAYWLYWTREDLSSANPFNFVQLENNPAAFSDGNEA